MAARDSSDEIAHAKTVAGQAKPAVTVESEIGERPESDKLARAVARARIADKLFAKQEQVKLGRYHLLELVGSGGMGVVWGAWDPELDRRVAIKIVKAEMQAARDRILLEGQALAKLSHPNVVPVYDVGVVDEQVYLVMEWIRGKNLRSYCKEPRSVREIVALYRAAGEGLAAAHRVGLIHRDFKPDNAMRGDDGRVKVLDFGLARGEIKVDESTVSTPPSSDLTRGAGTPRYMPPEQAEGGVLTPAVDQYALGVSLREALVGRAADGKKAEVPGWLEEIIDRATAHEPGKRYASMDALVHALGRDPRTIWRRRLLVAGAIGFAGAAFAVGTLRADKVASCTGGKDEIGRVWSAAVRDKLVTHLRGLGPYGQDEAKRLVSKLDDYGARWAVAHRDACQAKQRGELTPQLYERNLGCLARARVALDTVVGVLATVDKERLPDAVFAASGLPTAERCVTETTTSAIEPPPASLAVAVNQLGNEIEAARVLALTGTPNATAIAESAARKAEQLGYLPLVARARLIQGHALILQDQAIHSIKVLDQSVKTGIEANDELTAVEAYAREIYAIAVTSKTDPDFPPNATDTLGAISMFESLAKRLGAAGNFGRALLFNSIGVVRMTAGNPDEARTWFQRAVREPQVTKAAQIELAHAWGNLALVTKDRARQEDLLIRQPQQLERELGPDHPLTLEGYLRHAMFAIQPSRARDLLETVCDRYVTIHPHLTQRTATCAFELGWLAHERGDKVALQHWMSLVNAEMDVELANGYSLLVDNRLDDVTTRTSALVSRLEKGPDPWVRFKLADAHLLLGLAEVERHREEVAIAHLRKALATLQQIAFLSATAPYQRRIARVRALLARQLVKRDGAAAKQLAADASTWYEQAGGYDAITAEMKSIATGSR